ncbi:MAG: hypothetical protein ACJ8FY_14730 [Gemmataceae bacterium]
MICRKWMALGIPAKGLALAAAVFWHAGAYAQDSKSHSGKSANTSLQRDYGFHQTSWQSWSAQREPANPAALPASSGSIRPAISQRSALYNPIAAPVLSKRAPEPTPVIQPVTYLEVPSIAQTAAPQPEKPVVIHKPVYGEQPLRTTHEATVVQPLNWAPSPPIPSPQPLPAKPAVSHPIASPAEQGPVLIEWVPVRPSASPYKPQP